MKDPDNIDIPNVRHEAVFEIDESGTEAAAVTAASFTMESFDLSSIFRESGDRAAQTCRDGLTSTMKPMKPLTFRRGFIQAG